MENLFGFDYELNNLKNKNGSDSNFFAVYGEGGKIMHCKKDSYELVTTKSLSLLGNAFIDKGFDVKTFTHRHGEIIGLNVSLGQKMTKVGDKDYNALITVPNNGGGKGFLSIKENRLVCTNGLVRSMSGMKEKSIKIPHTLNYERALDLMKKSIIQFKEYIWVVEEKEDSLLKEKLKETDVLFLLNKWFFEKEMPSTHKADMSFNEFRLLLIENPSMIKSIERYNQLMKAMQDELSYNKVLQLELSKYTTFAIINNYLSRRIEQSNSTASQEVQFSRQAEKVLTFDLSI